MRTTWLMWFLVVLASCANLKLFVLRWASPLPQTMASFVSDGELNSLALGVSGAALTAGFLRLVRGGRLLFALLLVALSFAWAWSLSQLVAFSTFFALGPLVWIGGALGILAFSSAEETAQCTGAPRSLRSCAVFFFSVFNILLLVAPLSSQLPSYVQDRYPYEMTLRLFYFGSVHSDTSPVSMALRYLINLFFEHPSINATAISSIIYLSLALALSAVSVQLVFGRAWAWMLLAVALTDKWVLVAGLSSAVLGQPVLAGAAVLYLCTWAATRPDRELSTRESVVLGVVTALGVVFNLYSYSAARMTWLFGTMAFGAILVGRRAVWANARSVLRIGLCCAPSVVAVLVIWAGPFQRDSERFAGQLFISPPAAHRIAHSSDYPGKLSLIHDPDVPIWWGTARPEGENISLYWRRSPGEILEKAGWFLGKMGEEFLPLPSLVFLGVLGLVIGLASKLRDVWIFSASTMVLASSAFLTYLLAQDYGAYRRAVSTNLFLSVGVIVMFAALSRRGRWRIFSLVMCALFVALKAPGQVNALIDTSLYAYTCPICQPHLDIRDLQNAPLFDSVRQREVRIVVEEGGTLPFYGYCAGLAINSAEFKAAAPGASVLELSGKRLSEIAPSLPKGSVLVVSCTKAQSPEIEATRDPLIRSICDGTPGVGPIIGNITSKAFGPNVWWAFSEVS